MSSQKNNTDDPNILHDPDAGYEKAEMDLLRDALKKNYTERFKMMTVLMKTNIMMRKAKITYKPYTLNK